MAERFTALWQPAWYALDQKIRAGAAAKFLLTKDELRTFFNGMGIPTDAAPVYAQVLSITHPSLGNIDEVDTHGMSYNIWLNRVDLVQVDAEHRPGTILHTTLSGLVLNAFDLVVELQAALPSQVGELDMIAVMLNDDTDFFKWWGHALEDADDAALAAGAIVHYIRSLLKSGDEAGLRTVMRFIDKMYAWGNPYFATLFDEEVMEPLAAINEAEVLVEEYAGEEAKKSYLLFKEKKGLLASL